MPSNIYAPFIVNAPDMARLLFDRLRTDGLQGRKQCIWNDKLAKAAQEHCEDEAKRGYFSHVTPEGIGPNRRIEAQGYHLPEWYGQERDANNCESIAGGYETVDKVWLAWMNSLSHRVHILGLSPFYAEQVQVGIGYCKVDSSTYVWYWAFESCP